MKIVVFITNTTIFITMFIIKIHLFVTNLKIQKIYLRVTKLEIQFFFALIIKEINIHLVKIEISTACLDTNKNSSFQDLS